MKTGDVISRSDLIQKGFRKVCNFAGCEVYKRWNQLNGHYTYVFYNWFNKQIKTILNTEE